MLEGYCTKFHKGDSKVHDVKNFVNLLVSFVHLCVIKQEKPPAKVQAAL